MANTINNLLVGIGFDLDKGSMDGVTSGIDGVRSKALQLGGVVAGAFGIKALTSDFAGAKDKLGKFAEVFGVTADDVHAYGNALQQEGGTLEGFMGQLASVEKFRAGLAVGNAGFIASAGVAGLDVDGLVRAENATEAFLTLADQFQRMTTKQRINAARSLGLDESAIRLLSKGRKEIEAIANEQRKIRPITDKMTKSAAEFNDQFRDLTNYVGGFADKISDRLLPEINSVVGGMNAWMGANQGIINSGLDSFMDSISGNAVAIGAALTAISAGVALGAGGKMIGGFGGKMKSPGTQAFGKHVGAFGGFVGKMGALALAWEIGQAAGDFINESLLDKEDKDVIGGTITQLLANFGHGASQDVLELKNKAYDDQIQQVQQMRKARIQRETLKAEITNKIYIDGKQISDMVHKTVGDMARDAADDLKSVEGG